MTTINVYLTFNGNCEEAFLFYKSVFGGEFSHVAKFSEMPEDPKCPISNEDKDKIMHVSLPISKETVLMGSDTGGEWASQYKAGNNFSISVAAESQDAADNFFNNLSKDGKIIMPMDKTFWGSHFGMFVDKYGIQWMVSFDEAHI